MIKGDETYLAMMDRLNWQQKNMTKVILGVYREELIKKIEGMNKKPKLEPGNMQDYYKVGYNACLFDIVSLIKKGL